LVIAPGVLEPGASYRIVGATGAPSAWQTINSFARRDPKLRGQIGAHAVLHTHNRRLEYHPHVHLIVPAGAINGQKREWRAKVAGYLFPAGNLARVFRAKWYEGMRRLGMQLKTPLPREWIVNCKSVGRGDKALVYLGRYLYRGVLPEKNIIADHEGRVSFFYRDNKGRRQVCTLPGGEFLWLLLRHVLPRRFRRVRDFGLLHGNAKRLIQLVQLLLRVVVPIPALPREKAPVLCPLCQGQMRIIALRERGMTPLLC
jgi:hypothetical protein